jgi:hypothetical protein
VVKNLKPLVRAQRSPALVQRAGVSLSRALEEELFRCAEVLSEGSRRTTAGQRDSYFGSTMISIDLDRLRPLFRGGLDGLARKRLARAIDGSVRVRLRAMRLARAEAVRRVQDRSLGTVQVETRVRLTESHLHIDVDLEVLLSVSSAAHLP